jgi:hypothetical protein
MDNNSPILICGSGRSGTTWILDVLAESNNLRTIFEPLLPIALTEAKGFANLYVRDDSDEPELRKFFKKLFDGQIDNIWTKYRIRKDSLSITAGELFSLDNIKLIYSRYTKFLKHYRRYGKIKSGQLAIKFIRANLMLGWLVNNFGTKIIFVIRHPAAVVSSKLFINKRAGKIIWNFKDDLQRYSQNKNLKEDFLYKYQDCWNRSLSFVSGCTINWCIENAIALQNARKHEICVVFYEDLVAYPEIWWKKIIDYLKLKHIPNEKIISRPSHEAPKDIKTHKFKRNQFNKWTQYLSEEQKNEINRILEIFNINFYDALKPMPINNDLLN